MLLWSSMVFLLPLVLVLICSNGVFTLAEKQLLSLKRLPPARPEYTPTRPSHKSRTRDGVATVLEMKHMDHEKLEKRVINDDFRVKSIQSRIRNTISDSTQQQQSHLPLISGLKLQTLNYIVTITLGNKNLTLIVDTGSDLTWVQCQPCRVCYTQPDPLFNPSTSPSYQSLPCNSKPCHTLQYMGNSGLCAKNHPPSCNYAVTYGDGSYTRGEMGLDRLILGDIYVEKFVFGCGRDNKGLFGSASGLMGLGKSDLSLISQTHDVFDGVFSYCLPDSDYDSDSSGSLTLGNDASFIKNVSYTRMLQNPQLYSFYIVNMTGITVGGVGVESPNFGKNGVLFDSGTVITRLPPPVYRGLKAEVLKGMSGFPSAPGYSILETCFDLSGYEEVSIPAVKMQFEGGAEMSVDVDGMFYFVKKDASQVCLAVASLAYEDEIGIIGNYQQRNTRVVYDTKQMKLGFAKEICSFS